MLRKSSQLKKAKSAFKLKPVNSKATSTQRAVNVKTKATKKAVKPEPVVQYVPPASGNKITAATGDEEALVTREKIPAEAILQSMLLSGDVSDSCILFVVSLFC
jgi:hypothetical protein